MEDFARAAVVGQVEGQDVDAGESTRERVRSGRVRAVAEAHEQRALVEPERVAAFGERRRLEPRGNRDSGCLEVAAEVFRFALPLLLAGPEEQRASVGD